MHKIRSEEILMGCGFSYELLRRYTFEKIPNLDIGFKTIVDIQENSISVVSLLKEGFDVHGKRKSRQLVCPQNRILLKAGESRARQGENLSFFAMFDHEIV